MHIPDAVCRARARSPRHLRQPAAVAGRVRAARAAAHGDARRARRSSAGRAVTHTLAVVDTLSTDDLRACAARVDAWHDGGLATPLAPRRARVRALARRVPVRVRRHPRRPRASCPAAIRSTGSRRDRRSAPRVRSAGAQPLLHLREGYLETRGRGDALAVLIVRIGAARSPRCSRASRGSTASPPATTPPPARHVERRLSLPVDRVAKSSRSPASARSRRPTPSGCFRRTSTPSNGS